MKYQIYKANRWPERLGEYQPVGEPFDNENEALEICGDLNSDEVLQTKFHYKVEKLNDTV